ncbi:hypothetical protein O3G_MSEX000794 [Manduca sexta]|nr:hypothetical protein O3G_MSEX000794 [Manduca sexta]
MPINRTPDTKGDLETTKPTHRRKAKTTDDTNNNDKQLTAQISEIKQMFLDFKTLQEQKFEKLYTSFEEIKKQNIDIHSSINYLSNSYDTLKDQLQKLETERQTNLQYIKTLEDKLDKLESSSRSTSIEIRNIPIQKQESKQTLLSTINTIGTAISAPVEQLQIKDIYRINSKDKDNRPIIVDFTSVLTKENFINMYKKINKDKSKLTTDTIKISGPSKPIFISENLTPKMKRLFFLSRDIAKTKEYKYCWVSHGKIFLRKFDGSSIIQIKSENDIDCLRNQI